jgi:hypothetical protein
LLLEQLAACSYLLSRVPSNFPSFLALRAGRCLPFLFFGFFFTFSCRNTAKKREKQINEKKDPKKHPLKCFVKGF